MENKMRTRFKRVSENSLDYDKGCDALPFIVEREPSLVDEFYHVSCISESDGTECISLRDPIFLIFDQQRLSQLGDGAIKMWLDTLQPSNDPLSELRSKCTDDQLIQMIKSRHLQAPSEIKAWAEYMDNNMDLFNQELEKVRASQDPAPDPVSQSE